jgi:hypothetical protein
VGLAPESFRFSAPYQNGAKIHSEGGVIKLLSTSWLAHEIYRHAVKSDGSGIRAKMVIFRQPILHGYPYGHNVISRGWLIGSYRRKEGNARWAIAKKNETIFTLATPEIRPRLYSHWYGESWKYCLGAIRSTKKSASYLRLVG